MKKYTLFCLAAVLLTAVLSAAADSIWTPIDDYFMGTWTRENDQTCTSLSRVFYMAAGEQGYVTAFRTPLDHTPLETYPNGTLFRIAFICGKGDNLWGAVEAVRAVNEVNFIEDWSGESGYIPLSDLVRAFDGEAFAEVYRDRIIDFNKDGLNFCALDDFVLWMAPNSGVQVEYVSKDYISYLCMDYCQDCEPSDFTMYHYGGFYADPEGRRWIEVTLRRDTEHGWFCLDALTDGGVKPVY